MHLHVAMLFWIFSNYYFLKISRPPIWQFETEHFLSGLLKLKLETVNQWCSHKWCRACIHYKFLFRILWKFQKTPISWSEDRVLSYGNKSMSVVSWEYFANLLRNVKLEKIAIGTVSLALKIYINCFYVCFRTKLTRKVIYADCVLITETFSIRWLIITLLDLIFTCVINFLFPLTVNFFDSLT